ncbi:MAG: toll/interleukin-1 receptor domain-containing protein [Prevotella sp.]|jgi:hypothetical protein|nr:toll/interleukin-1 receptor domain-containing protein [Prevotella sp.]MCH4242121.1 toll/interleukin-1 receptor domain-containing protein [Prevotella sp.]
MEKLTDNISPKVFISYSHDSGEHKDWVLKLATDLQHHGVNVILDQWDVRLGDDLPFFMEQGLSSSNLVLCICSDAYTEKANANKGGVGYEKKIITADLMTKSSANYIIPIKRNNKIDKIPTFFGATLYIDFNDDSKYFDNYRTLLARIYNEDIKLKPALGNNPFKTKELSSKISLGLSLGTVNFQDPALSGKVSFDYSKNDGDFLIGNGEYAFTTHWSTAGMGCIYCYRDKVRRIGYNPSFKDFPSRDSITKFDFSSRCRTINEGQIVILENQNNKFAAIKVTKIFKNVNDFGHLLNFEYQIYRDF